MKNPQPPETTPDTMLEASTEAPAEQSPTPEKSADTGAPKKTQKTAKASATASKPQQKTTPKKPRRWWLLLLTLLVIIVAAATAYGLYFLWQQQRAGFSAHSAALAQWQTKQTTQTDAFQAALDDYETTLASAAQKQQLADAEHQTLNTGLQQLSARLGRSSVAWRLAEVDYLLTVANHRLALERDHTTAIVALETADQRLHAIGDPALLPVRRQISAELTALKAVEAPDLPGIAMSLGALAEAVANLPIVDSKPSAASTTTEATESDPSPDWRQLSTTVWREISGLVRIRRHQQPLEPLLPPEEEWYLRQNLRLNLEQARLTVLRRDTALLQQLLAESERWLGAYFDPDSAPVRSMHARLSALSSIELTPTLPDISASLRALRQYRQALSETSNRDD